MEAAKWVSWLAGIKPDVLADLSFAIFVIVVWLGAAISSFAAACAAVWHLRGQAIHSLERALQREISMSAANESHARATINRLRSQRNELLAACADARSALLEVQLEARAREERIRKQAKNSDFGPL